MFVVVSPLLGMCRMSAAEALRHPFFWSIEKRMHFLLDLSDTLETVQPRLNHHDTSSPRAHFKPHIYSTAIHVVYIMDAFTMTGEGHQPLSPVARAAP